MDLVLSLLILLVALSDFTAYLSLSKKFKEFEEKHDNLVTLTFSHIFDNEKHLED